jgi:hypothetical protein
MTRLLKLTLSIYQTTLSLFLSTFFGRGCRYTPTCSEYAKDAITKYGVREGSIKTGKRLLHCHPWGGYGYDPA